jgi:hypothetical protein
VGGLGIGGTIGSGTCIRISDNGEHKNEETGVIGSHLDNVPLKIMLSTCMQEDKRGTNERV